MATSEQQLVALLLEADETIVVKAIQTATQERQKNGLGTDILDELKSAGIEVLTTPLEKPWYLSKKVWAAVFALVILIADEFFAPDLWRVAAAPLVYVFGQGLADLGKNRSAAA